MAALGVAVTVPDTEPVASTATFCVDLRFRFKSFKGSPKDPASCWRASGLREPQDHCCFTKAVRNMRSRHPLIGTRPDLPTHLFAYLDVFLPSLETSRPARRLHPTRPLYLGSLPPVTL